MIETTAKKANGNGSPAELPFNAGSVMTSAAIAIVITALRGVPLAFTFARLLDAGRPRSRAKAKHILDALVRQARPQKSWPRVEIRTTALKAAVLNERLKISSELPAP